MVLMTQHHLLRPIQISGHETALQNISSCRFITFLLGAIALYLLTQEIVVATLVTLVYLMIHNI